MDRPQLYRDGFIAVAACAAVLLGSRALGVDGGVFAEPLPAAVGCIGTVAIELVLVRNPDRARRIWDQRVVQVGCTLGVVGGGALAAWVGAVWVVAVLVWGLVAYVALVGVVLVSGRNPLARIG